MSEIAEEKLDDETLLERSQKGDEKATRALIFRYSGLVRMRARGFFLVGGETEDLIQEGMIGLYSAILSYKTYGKGRSFKNFAYLCVTRQMIDAVKRYSSKKSTPPKSTVSIEEAEGMSFEITPEDMIILSDDRRELQQKMSRVLSDFEFKITTMYMDGMSYAEICEATGKTAKSVDNAIQRSKKKLQKVFKE